jgi:hypothetical protein
MVRVIEFVALAFTLICAVLIWRIYAVTNAKAMFLLGAGYVWWAILKVGLVCRVDFIVSYSGTLALGIGILMALGLWLFLRVLKKSYNGGKK